MIFLIKEKKVRKSCQSRLLYNDILVYSLFYTFETLLYFRRIPQRRVRVISWSPARERLRKAGKGRRKPRVGAASLVQISVMRPFLIIDFPLNGRTVQGVEGGQWTYPAVSLPIKSLPWIVRTVPPPRDPCVGCI